MKIITEEQIFHRVNNGIIKKEEYVSINNLCEWLQETFGNSDNINLILNEIGRCRKE